MLDPFEWSIIQLKMIETKGTNHVVNEKKIE